MKTLLRKLTRKLADSDGQSLVEYTLVLALVVLVCVTALTLLGTRSSFKINAVAAQLQ